jgi:hypothetical protein
MKKDKKRYFIPIIEVVLLDNEISLSMESEPPVGPGEIVGILPQCQNNDPHV